MDFSELELDDKVEFVRSHSCSGRMERHYSDLLKEEFSAYQDFLCMVFEVGDISYVNVWKQKFGFLEEGSDTYNELLANEKFSQGLSSDSIAFKAHVCDNNGIRFIVVTWDNDQHKSLWPKCFVYARKKDDINLIIS